MLLLLLLFRFLFVFITLLFYGIAQVFVKPLDITDFLNRLKVLLPIASVDDAIVS